MSASSQVVARFVTIMMGLVIGLSFLFGFGNVLNLALKLQVPVLVAPLVAPAVDLTVLGLLVGTRHLALTGAGEDVLRPTRRLLLAASAVTLLLNIADPIFAGQWGKAAFDSVGPLLLIGWADTGPGLFRALRAANIDLGSVQPPLATPADLVDDDLVEDPTGSQYDKQLGAASGGPAELDDRELLERARQADAEHWQCYRRPISAETLRKQLRVGAKASRELVAVVRSENVQRGCLSEAQSSSAEVPRKLHSAG
ncbi:hypothetical protein VA596_02010 [Amycolatopsis sp., V23-08]|uniref:DUF2637 domain-containing protein n=1 Tax=Amycolatopsis heterodermiae TaxID=3110235 RepID=A0ABU5QWK0_9PSEU|nr:hypothetical protein [Amycolatopsis sp., V23-08]MEA5358297.1 hypothetical protein [Amycolatopsis sp., V23-08]